MRPLVSAFTAVSLLAGAALAPTAWAGACARPAEMRAFQVAGLKSELMVVAISCQAQDRYNGFISRYKRDLQTDERALHGYFARTAGRSAQRAHDDYITNLANAESQDGLHQGTLFCQQHLVMFDEVMALKDGKDLQSYAESKSLAQPIEVSECPAPKKKKLHTASEK
ncbi:MAG TPA: hypothetical protein VFN46_06880 [Acetobacteraceae bacterium]|nr:hypothetical protein [Acetobacteraceae bacterium]